MTAPVNRPPSLTYRVGPDCSKACRQAESYYPQALQTELMARWSSGASARDQHAYLIGLGYTTSVSSLSRHKRHLVPVDIARETAEAAASAAEAALPPPSSLSMLDRILSAASRSITPNSRVSVSDALKALALRETITGSRSLDQFYEAVSTAFDNIQPEAITEADKPLPEEGPEPE